MSRRRAVCDAADRADAAAANGQRLAPASVATTSSPARKRVRTAAAGRTRRLSDPLVGEPGDPRSARYAVLRRPSAGGTKPTASTPMSPPAGRPDSTTSARSTAGPKGVHAAAHLVRPDQRAAEAAERSRSDREPALDHRCAGRDRPARGRGSRRRTASPSPRPSSSRAGGIRTSRHGRSRCPTERCRPEGSRTDDSGRFDPPAARPASRPGRARRRRHDETSSSPLEPHGRFRERCKALPPRPDSPAAHERTGPARGRGETGTGLPGKRPRVVRRREARRRRRCRSRSRMVATSNRRRRGTHPGHHKAASPSAAAMPLRTFGG